MVNKTKTLIQVSIDTKNKLDNLKLMDRDTYNNVIIRLLDEFYLKEIKK